MARTIAITAATVLVGFAVAVSSVRAVEGTDNSDPKSCPKGSRYSSSKGRCVKTSCGVGEAWNSAADACADGRSAALSDEDLYLAGRDLGQDGRYAEALKLFFRMRDRHQARVLSSIGYSTRKLGDIDKGIDYYHQALAIDPNYTKVREYLGEAYLQKGAVGQARNSSWKSPTAAGVRAKTMNFWRRQSQLTVPAKRQLTGRHPHTRAGKG